MTAVGGHPLGLHARASAKIVDVASRFRCTVSLVAKGRRASARTTRGGSLPTISTLASARCAHTIGMTLRTRSSTALTLAWYAMRPW